MNALHAGALLFLLPLKNGPAVDVEKKSTKNENLEREEKTFISGCGLGKNS